MKHIILSKENAKLFGLSDEANCYIDTENFEVSIITIDNQEIVNLTLDNFLKTLLKQNQKRVRIKDI